MENDDDWTVVVKNHNQQSQKQQPQSQQHTKPEKQKKSILSRPAAAMPLQPQPWGRPLPPPSQPKGIQQQHHHQQQQHQHQQQQQQRVLAKQDTSLKPAKQSSAAVTVPPSKVSPGGVNGVTATAGAGAGAVPGGITPIAAKKSKAPSPSTKGVTLFDLMLFKKQPTMAAQNGDKEKKSSNVVATGTTSITTSSTFSSTSIANAMNNANAKTSSASLKFNIDEFKAKRFLVKKNKKKKLSVMKKRILMVCHYLMYS